MSKEMTAHNSAMDAVADYLTRAVRVIDAQFGDGYAKANPELVATFIRACAKEYGSLVGSA